MTPDQEQLQDSAGISAEPDRFVEGDAMVTKLDVPDAGCAELLAAVRNAYNNPPGEQRQSRSCPKEPVVRFINGNVLQIMEDGLKHQRRVTSNAIGATSAATEYFSKLVSAASEVAIQEAREKYQVGVLASYLSCLF